MTSTVNPRLKSLDEAMRLQVPELKTMTGQVDYRFRENEKALFRSQGASGGNPWPPLSEKYRKWKKKAFPGRKIMALTGKTRKSLTTKGAGHIARGIGSGSRVRIVVGTSHRTPAYHIDDSPLKNPNVPERDTLQTTETQYKQYRNIIHEYLQDVKWPRVERTLAAWNRHRRGVA